VSRFAFQSLNHIVSGGCSSASRAKQTEEQNTRRRRAGSGHRKPLECADWQLAVLSQIEVGGSHTRCQGEQVAVGD
jgi:hypothetical protein